MIASFCEFNGKYMQYGSQDINGYITSADVKERVNGTFETVATMAIFLEASNSTGIRMNSALG